MPPFAHPAISAHGTSSKNGCSSLRQQLRQRWSHIMPPPPLLKPLRISKPDCDPIQGIVTELACQSRGNGCVCVCAICQPGITRPVQGWHSQGVAWRSGDGRRVGPQGVLPMGREDWNIKYRRVLSISSWNVIAPSPRLKLPDSKLLQGRARVDPRSCLGLWV